MARALVAPVVADFDPMIYDIMRETATELRGELIWLSRHAETETDREAARTAHTALWEDVNGIDGFDLPTIEAKALEYRTRLQQLRATA